MSGEWDFMDGVSDDDVKAPARSGKKEFTPMPEGDHYVVGEILEAEKVETKDGKGKRVKMSIRVCDERWMNQRAWGSYFTETSDPDKIEGAKNGARAFARLLQAAGFVIQKEGRDEKTNKALVIGIAREFDKETFHMGLLVGQYARFKVRVPKADANGKVWPSVEGAYPIDPDDYHDIVKAIPAKRAAKKDEGEQPPF